MSIEDRTHISSHEVETRDDEEVISPRTIRRRIAMGVAGVGLVAAGYFGGSWALSGNDNVEAKGPQTTASGPAVAGGEASPSQSPEAAKKPTLDNIKVYNIYDGHEVELNGLKEIAAQAKVPAEAASSSNEASKYLFEHGIPKLINTGIDMHTQKLYDTTPDVMGDGNTYGEHTKLLQELGVFNAVVDELFVPLDPSNPQDASLVQDKAALAKFIQKLNADTAYAVETTFTNTGAYKPQVTEADLVTRPKSVEVNETADAVTTSYRFSGVTTTETFAIRMQQVGDEWKIRALKEIPASEN